MIKWYGLYMCMSSVMDSSSDTYWSVVWWSQINLLLNVTCARVLRVEHIRSFWEVRQQVSKSSYRIQRLKVYRNAAGIMFPNRHLNPSTWYRIYNWCYRRLVQTFSETISEEITLICSHVQQIPDSSLSSMLEGEDKMMLLNKTNMIFRFFCHDMLQFSPLLFYPE